FEMGLFENPYVDPVRAKQNVRSKEHIQLARKAAQESVILLKNNSNILPLNKDFQNGIRKIAVIGPNADNRYNQLGDYTAPQEDSNVKTVLDGIRSKLNPSQIEYVKGCAIRDTTNLEFDKAVAAAKKADVAVVVVGGSSARDFKTKYIETGAAIASSEGVSDIESGEGYDRATLDLMGKQLDLLKAIKATGTPVVVIYIQGRPLNMNWAAENADALLTAWYPGQEGGNAIADVLFGDYNPAGRLTVSVPRSVGQLPVYYNKKNPKSHDYVEMKASPLYCFGYGLSYSKFEYSNLQIEKKGDHSFDVTFTLRNTGNCDGDEIAQLYLRDEVASTVQPIKQLKHFERVDLKKGEEKKITFSITENDLSVINPNMERVVEPGTFTLMIGASSDDIRLKDQIIVQ
ncbi:MAG: glycoside hydrolase family 3 C-terminal domain-containing protein, partial [Bacteroidota bacterium]|nr:glycoside hydrolase family 3 C-terminal domain-containing protein [Bacteroidota bacterium]